MASSGGAGVGAPQRYFCHQCERTVTLTPPPTSELACPTCHGGFLEELEPPPPTPNANPNPFISFPDPFFPAQFPFFLSASSSGGPPTSAAALGMEDVIGAFTGSAAPRSSPAADNFDALGNTLQFVLSRLHDLTAGGSQIQFIIENPGGSFGDYYVGPGLEQLIQQLAENDPNRYGTPPASKSAVESLPEVTVTEELLATDEAQCAVCKDTFEVGADAKQMPCKHIYHKDCILPWLELHNSCPVCRYELPTDDPEYEHRMRGTPPPANRAVGSEDGAGRAGAGAGSGTVPPREGGSPGGRSGERNVRISLPWSIRALLGVGGSGRDGGNNDAGAGAGDANSSARGGQDS